MGRWKNLRNPEESLSISEHPGASRKKIPSPPANPREGVNPSLFLAIPLADSQESSKNLPRIFQESSKNPCWHPKNLQGASQSVKNPRNIPEHPRASQSIPEHPGASQRIWWKFRLMEEEMFPVNLAGGVCCGSKIRLITWAQGHLKSRHLPGV